MSKPLVIISCGKGKIWDRYPSAGPTPAQDAYIGPPFLVNRAYARHFGARWVILSAKYGFIDPEFQIEDYNVSFKDPSSHTVRSSLLKSQVRELGLDQFNCVVGLGGEEYRLQMRQAFSGLPTVIEFPFAGLIQGKAMSATKAAIMKNDSPC